MTRMIIHAWFPHLAAERVRRDGDVPSAQPLVMTRAVNGAELVESVCPLAHRQGLRGGMRLADARALRPDLVSRVADDAADRQDLYHLAMWARLYCPLTAPAATRIAGVGASIAHDGNGIWLDVAGATHLKGGIRSLLADMARRLRRAGLTARLAVAPTCGVAWGLARYAPAVQCYGFTRFAAPSSRQLASLLAGLPLAALRLDGTVCTAMAASGLRRVGDILGMARAPLAARFGQGVTYQLDAALGHVNESFTPLKPATPRVAMRQFAEPVAAPEDIHALVISLADEMVGILQQQGIATRRLQLGWQRVDNMVKGRDVHFSRPSRDSGAFRRLLKAAAETVDPEFGIERMWLEAHDCSPQAPVVARFDEGISTSEAYASLVDRLVARLGYGAVLHMRARPCWQPEGAQYAAYADMENADFDDVMNSAPQSLTAPPRPIRLLGAPQKLAVVALLPDHPPAQFVWQKRTHKVTRASGPERIAPQWWHAAAGTKTRDYFRLQDEDGARFWVYREGLPERGEEPGWFLHGFFA